MSGGEDEFHVAKHQRKDTRTLFVILRQT